MNVRIKLTSGRTINYNHIMWMSLLPAGVEFTLTNAHIRGFQNTEHPEQLLDYINQRLDEIGSINFQGGSLLIDLKDADK